MRTLKLMALVVLAGSNLALAADGARPYNAKCASCHGKDGKGQTETGQKKHVKDLTDSKVQASLKDADLVKAITDGIDETPDHGKMPGYKDKLSDDEVKAVAAYVRTLKGK
jgi:cbb3-type cytochrome c oxidase subunit III